MEDSGEANAIRCLHNPILSKTISLLISFIKGMGNTGVTGGNSGDYLMGNTGVCFGDLFIMAFGLASHFCNKLASGVADPKVKGLATHK